MSLKRIIKIQITIIGKTEGLGPLKGIILTPALSGQHQLERGETP